MDERIQRLDREFSSGRIGEEEYTLRKLNNDLRLGFKPNIGTIMSTPAGVMYFNGEEWGQKSAPPNQPTIAASGVIPTSAFRIVGSGVDDPVQQSFEAIARMYYDTQH